MTLLINFITAVAWIWGGLMGLGVVLCALETIFTGKRLDTTSTAELTRSGLFAWAWLIARYWL